MKARIIVYWIVTALTAVSMGGGGVADLLGAEEVMKGLAALGYPAYLGKLLGTWKILATIAILAPGFPRLKEWAYAGIVFDLTGAAISHAAVGDPIGNVITPLVPLAFAVASWALRPASRRMGSGSTTASAASTAAPATGSAPRVAA